VTKKKSRKQRVEAKKEMKGASNMPNFPPFQFQPMPEDNKKDISTNPTDDDGTPLQLDTPTTYAALPGCTLVQPPTDGDHAGDALWVTVVPDDAAKSGDIVGVTATIVSQGVTSTQDGQIQLTTGGAIGAGFLESAPRSK